jgi:hypothetical protein
MAPWLVIQTIQIEFSISIIKFISTFLSNRKFRVSVKGEISTPREIQAAVSQGSVLAPTLYSLYISYPPPPPTLGVHLAFFADNTCIYATDHKGVYVLRKMQLRLTSVASWCERWSIKWRQEEKTQAICFCHWRKRIEAHLIVNVWNILFISH